MMSQIAGIMKSRYLRVELNHSNFDDRCHFVALQLMRIWWCTLS
jgi:hypothetical protein